MKQHVQWKVLVLLQPAPSVVVGPGTQERMSQLSPAGAVVLMASAPELSGSLHGPLGWAPAKGCLATRWKSWVLGL